MRQGPSPSCGPRSLHLLSKVPGDAEWLTVLGLKDAFFCRHLHPNSQFLFAFEDPADQSTQLTWATLPQGFRESPHLFGQALAQNLCQLDLPQTKVYREH